MAKKLSNKLPTVNPGLSLATDSPKSYKPSPEEKARERRWRAEDALRTVKEYEKVCADKALMKDVKSLAREEVSRLKKIL